MVTTAEKIGIGIGIAIEAVGLQKQITIIDSDCARPFSSV